MDQLVLISLTFQDKNVYLEQNSSVQGESQHPYEDLLSKPAMSLDTNFCTWPKRSHTRVDRRIRHDVLLSFREDSNTALDAEQAHCQNCLNNNK